MSQHCTGESHLSSAMNVADGSVASWMILFSGCYCLPILRARYAMPADVSLSVFRLSSVPSSYLKN